MSEMIRPGGWFAALLLGGGSLAFYWAWGDASIRAKVILSALYAATWGLLLVPSHSVYLFPVAQMAFVIIILWMTFGTDLLMRELRH